ncbi:hypothetical protein F2Q69_00043750 [Brassica cretica]|uniref:Uncharacterized protein n=1 Tax=Brassica cretica TaxID=69181 RepID=A0A8S9NJH9_BRACR|nr:hypothetical protein F2Q69_00043750 [Brassica cretica]
MRGEADLNEFTKVMLNRDTESKGRDSSEKNLAGVKNKIVTVQRDGSYATVREDGRMKMILETLVEVTDVERRRQARDGEISQIEASEILMLFSGCRVFVANPVSLGDTLEFRVLCVLTAAWKTFKDSRFMALVNGSVWFNLEGKDHVTRIKVRRSHLIDCGRQSDLASEDKRNVLFRVEMKHVDLDRRDIEKNECKSTRVVSGQMRLCIQWVGSTRKLQGSSQRLCSELASDEVRSIRSTIRSEADWLWIDSSLVELSSRISVRSERVPLQVESCIYINGRAHLRCFLASGGAWFISEGFLKMVQFNSGFKGIRVQFLWDEQGCVIIQSGCIHYRGYTPQKCYDRQREDIVQVLKEAIERDGDQRLGEVELRDREVSVKSEKAKGCRYQGLVKCRRSAKYSLLNRVELGGVFFWQRKRCRVKLSFGQKRWWSYRSNREASMTRGCGMLGRGYEVLASKWLKAEVVQTRDAV